MKSKWTLSWLSFLLILTSCTSPAVSATTTPVPAQPTRDPQTIYFITPDQATIQGILYGTGETAVIFSVMGNCKRGWDDMAALVAQNGIIALTYQWRGCRESGTVDNNQIKKFVDDLRGAIQFMREQGAKKIILAGASLGGVGSAKLVVESKADGLIVIASPPEIPEWGFEVKAADMNSNIPKLFITAESDDTVAASKTQALYDLAAEPKEWQTYPGTAHGTDLFETEQKEQLQQRILNFILSVASMRQPV